MDRRLTPGELVWVAPDSGLYPADDFDGDADIPTTDDWELALIIGTDHVKAACGQHPWFLILIHDALHFIGRHCLMTSDQTPSSIRL